MKEFHRIVAIFNFQICEVAFHQSILRIFPDVNYRCSVEGGGGGGRATNRLHRQTKVVEC